MKTRDLPAHTLPRCPFHCKAALTPSFQAEPHFLNLGSNLGEGVCV